MRILIDIGHPAHVHYFKNLIWNLKRRSHEIVITAREKEVSLYLLDKYGFKYRSTGKNKSSILGKAFSILRNNFFIFKEAKKFNPDLFVSFFSPFAAHVGQLMNKPVVAFYDTESAVISIMFSKPFTNTIVVPSCYSKKLPERKEIRLNGYFELSYLHPKYFKPNNTVLDLLDVEKREKFTIMRFVSWSASHDIGHKGMNIEMKVKAVEEFSKIGKVFISSEKKLPRELEKYQIKIPPERMHDALYYATLLFGESSTMASECAVLGTPAIYIDNTGRGYTNEEEKKYNLVFNFSESIKDQILSIKKGVELLKRNNIKKEWHEKSRKMIIDKINVTDFMVWFIDQYPSSAKIMKENPAYQYRFK